MDSFFFSFICRIQAIFTVGGKESLTVSNYLQNKTMKVLEKDIGKYFHNFIFRENLVNMSSQYDMKKLKPYRKKSWIHKALKY